MNNRNRNTCARTFENIISKVLFLYGDADPWIPVAETIDRLQSLSHDLHNIEFAVVSNANHEMMTPGKETMQVDRNTVRSDEPQSAGYFMLLAAWLSRHVKQ